MEYRTDETGGAISVDGLSRERGASTRTIERQLDRWVGLSPKRSAASCATTGFCDSARAGGQRVTRTTVILVMWLAAGAASPIPGEAGAERQAPASTLPVWMVGCWTGEQAGERFHERWIAADSSTLLAVSHTVKAANLTAFEFLRVVMKSGKPVYVAQPGGAEPTEFVATSQTAERIVFENPAHDFPKRVIYERPGPDRLTASIDGGPASRQRVAFAMKRERCES